MESGAGSCRGRTRGKDSTKLQRRRAEWSRPAWARVWAGVTASRTLTDRGSQPLRSIRQKRASELFQDRTSQTPEALGQAESPRDEGALLGTPGLPSHPFECSLPGLESPAQVRQWVLL